MLLMMIRCEVQSIPLDFRPKSCLNAKINVWALRDHIPLSLVLCFLRSSLSFDACEAGIVSLYSLVAAAGRMRRK